MMENGSAADGVARISPGCQRQRRATGRSDNLRTSISTGYSVSLSKVALYIQMFHHKSIDV